MFLKLKILLTKMNRWVLLLVLIGAFLRFYRLPQIMQFAGDQGRDALRVARMLTEHDLVFIGPVTSIGNMYLGPFYYYFMLPWLALSYPSPIGPTYAVAMLSIATIALLYLLGKDLVGKNAAIFASFLFTFSSVAITYANFSWNPNPAPFFSLLLVWALYQVYRQKQRYWLLVATSFSILIQLHYLTLLAFFPIIIVWCLQFLALLKQRRLKFKKNGFLVNSCLAVLIGLLFFLPLTLFDLKHQGTNLTAFKNLMGGQNSITQFEPGQNNFLDKIGSIFGESHGRAMDILFDAHIGQERTRNSFLLVILIGLTLLLGLKKRIKPGAKLVILFVVTGILGTSFYSHNLYVHYVLYLLPLVFLYFGWLLSEFWQQRLIGKLLAVGLCLFFLIFNVQKYAYNDFNPNIIKLSQETQEITEKIQPNERYNIVLFSESRDYYGQNYRYFLSTIKDKKPIDPDFDTLTDVNTLLIVNELGLSQEGLLSTGIYELSGFESISDRQNFSTSYGTIFSIWRK